MILVVDDNPATLYATSRVLRHAGYEVIQASTGLQATEMAKREGLDLIVLDIDLPDMNGYEVCRMIRVMPATALVRVVYLSASFVEDTHKVKGFDAGADGFLTHPVEPEVLVAAVASLIRNRAMELELERSLVRERKAREDAERANQAKDDFLATLSHELRSPLTAIVGWAEVGRMRAAEQPEILKALTIIRRNAALQARLIADLLDVSRLTAGKTLELDREPVSLNDLVRGVVESSARAAEDRKIAIDVAHGDEALVVEGDPGRLAQAVSNLLSNAIKFSASGARVRIGIFRDGSSAVIEVVDNGRGIGTDVLGRIFDRFWQEDTSMRRSHGGLGLGLFIVSHIAKRHGGSVEAFSEGEGKGARFTLRLPLLAKHLATATIAPVVPTSEDDVNLSGVRVLLVDDDVDAREWVRQVVAAAGADTVDVPDVRSAVDAVATFQPHVIVSDLAMPGLTGFDLVVALRSAGHSAADLPIIALSAHASEDHERQALAGDFQFFVAKPPEPRALLQLIRRATR